MAEEIIFPNKIRIIRKLRGQPMQALAKELGISLSAISKIEKGYRRIDQEQLMKICDFLDCSMSDIFISEDEDDSTGVASAWKEEAERRVKFNETSGLKTFGAGLRYIRNQKNLTLSEVADSAGLTLSVYHRIEMGQREISEDEFYNIAKAFDMTTNEIIIKIYELNESGALDKFTQNETGPTTNSTNILRLANSSYGNRLLSMGANKTINLYGKAGENGEIIISNTDADKIESPVKTSDTETLYAVKLATRRLGNVLPTRATLYVDKNEAPSVGDIAVYYLDEEDKETRRAKIVSLKENDKGNLYGVMYNPEEKIDIPDNKLNMIHKVIFIGL